MEPAFVPFKILSYDTKYFLNIADEACFNDSAANMYFSF